MRENRGLAQLSRALRLGRRGRESEARTPDHYIGCPVAQLGVIHGISKQARYRAALRPDGSSLSHSL